MSERTELGAVSKRRRRFLAALGGSASVAVAGCSALLDDDDDGTGDDDDDDNGMDNGTDPNGDEDELEPADKAQAAWERIGDNPAPEDEDIRLQAHLEIEEAIRDDVIILPLQHGLTERFWYDYVDVPLTGVLGGHHQQHHETTVEGDTELNLMNATFTSLDPIQSTDTASSEVINQIYEPMVRYPNGEPQLENKLIDDFDVSDDDLTWTFHLKDGITFHDGSELTADDVVYSIRRLMESPHSERAAFALDSSLGLGVDQSDDPGVRAVDDSTVEIDLVGPNPGVLDILTYSGFAVIPEGLVGDVDGYDGEVEHSEFQTDMANGTGPFEFDDMTVNQEVRVVANDDYHDGAPEIDSIHWEIIEDDEAAFTYAMEQNADIFGIPTAQYDPDLIDASEDDQGRDVGTYGPLENDEIANYVAISEMSTFYFGFNAGSVPREVRQAVAFVTDHDELITEIYANRGVEAYSFSPPPLWPTGADGYNDWVDNWPYSRNETDVESANEVLAEAGYSPDDPFELTITTYETVVSEEAAELTRSKLAGSGVEMDIESAAFATLQERGEDGDLEMWTLGWIWSWEDLAYGHFVFEPKNTNTDLMPTETTGFYLDWHLDLDEYA